MADCTVRKCCRESQTEKKREKKKKITSFFDFTGCRCVKSNTDPGFAAALWARATAHRPTFISFSINDVCISRTSPGPAGTSIPAQLPWVQTHHSMSVWPLLAFCPSAEVCHRYRKWTLSFFFLNYIWCITNFFPCIKKKGLYLTIHWLRLHGYCTVHPSLWALVFYYVGKSGNKSVKEAVKPVAMSLFYSLYKDIITLHTVCLHATKLKQREKKEPSICWAHNSWFQWVSERMQTTSEEQTGMN